MFKALIVALALLATPALAEGTPEGCTSVADVYTEITAINSRDVPTGDSAMVPSTIDASVAKLYASAVAEMGGPTIPFDPTSIVVVRYKDAATLVFFKEGCAAGHLKVPYSIHVQILGRVQKSL